MISIEYVDSMGNDLTVVNAARVSYGAISEKFTERDYALIKFLADHNHVTPFRHPTIQIRCKAPIFLARQLGKHQVGFSWNEISRRYKDGDAIEIEGYVPNVVLTRAEKLMSGTSGKAEPDVTMDVQYMIRDAYAKAYRSYKDLIEMGIAPEQARMVLPQGMITEWVWSGSLYGFYSLWKQRSDKHAQYEAQVFAKQLDFLMSELYPICWKALTNKD